MDKYLFGKIIGEIYRIQKRIDPEMQTGSEARIFGLISGIEEAIDAELENIEFISKEKLSKFMNVLDEYHNDPDKLESLSGYYEIEDKLKQKDIGRAEAITMLTYLKAGRRFEEVINKFDSSSSPVECKRFDLDEYEI